MLCSCEKVPFCCVDTVKVTPESEKTFPWALRACTDAPSPLPLPQATQREPAAEVVCPGHRLGAASRVGGSSLQSPFTECLTCGEGLGVIMKKPRLVGEIALLGQMFPLPSCSCWHLEGYLIYLAAQTQDFTNPRFHPVSRRPGEVAQQ